MWTQSTDEQVLIHIGAKNFAFIFTIFQSLIISSQVKKKTYLPLKPTTLMTQLKNSVKKKKKFPIQIYSVSISASVPLIFTSIFSWWQKFSSI